MNDDGKGETKLTDQTTWDFVPQWSPDGGKIALVRVIPGPGSSPHGGDEEIHVMNADGSQVKRFTNALGVDYAPFWRPIEPDGVRTVRLGRGGGENSLVRIADLTALSSSEWMLSRMCICAQGRGYDNAAYRSFAGGDPSKRTPRKNRAETRNSDDHKMGLFR